MQSTGNHGTVCRHSNNHTVRSVAEAVVAHPGGKGTVWYTSEERYGYMYARKSIRYRLPHPILHRRWHRPPRIPLFPHPIPMLPISVVSFNMHPNIPINSFSSNIRYKGYCYLLHVTPIPIPHRQLCPHFHRSLYFPPPSFPLHSSPTPAGALPAQISSWPALLAHCPRTPPRVPNKEKSTRPRYNPPSPSEQGSKASKRASKERRNKVKEGYVI